MKKLIATLLLTCLCGSLIPMSVSADAPENLAAGLSGYILLTVSFMALVATAALVVVARRRKVTE